MKHLVRYGKIIRWKEGCDYDPAHIASGIVNEPIGCVRQIEKDVFRIIRVLWNAFKTEILSRPTELVPAPANLSGAAMALEIAEAVAALARQQLDLEQRYTTMADYMSNRPSTLTTSA
jgi:hypothetical protein